VQAAFVPLSRWTGGPPAVRTGIAPLNLEVFVISDRNEAPGSFESH
jgi:hypothetical protein